ncbi:enoyl-CoA hydratase/isomerase family protein [Streptomyces sp. 8L]|uniref:enoyl-CoA hydratase/isomerase family protein n=1 Tax=Streptomyces sp. 8L TaxID=2877242 RepID=UPI001CD34934|nr:enoyl-CoA hydratase/isomerase family protein [Streptomyces sp. 8L]MCA1223614.1 enoyl-CoA hydratase/isomerase family protein [Streptomyces sp. 8L]
MKTSGFAPHEAFDEYAERFQDYFSLRRENGIVELKMHDKGAATEWKKEHNWGWGAALRAIAADTDNEVLIIGGTGNAFSTGMDADYLRYVKTLQEEEPEAFSELILDTYQRVSKMIQTMLFEFDIPTIGVLNGPGFQNLHLELPFFTDFTLCAPDVSFSSRHYTLGNVPGDGWHFALQFMLGAKRANHLTLSGQEWSVRQALDWGMVGEIVPSQTIYDRAWEMAEDMMRKPRSVRRLTHELMTSSWRRSFLEEYRFQSGVQAWSGTIGACSARA